MTFTLIFSLLVLPNLGTKPLWQDEAETALVARQMVNSNTWLPYAYDDQGPISQDWNYQFSVSPLWRWHPWLQFYVTALSFKLIGVSAFSARLPFALLGIISYWYFLNFLNKNFVKSPEGWRARGLAALLFLFSTPLLLHFRQARYYSLSLLSTLIAIDGYLNKNWKKYIFGSVLLFHSFLPAALALQISFWIHQIRIKNTKRFATAFSITLPVTLPWAVWLKIGGQNLNFSPDLIKQHLIQHYVYIHKFIFPIFTLIPLISPILKSLRATEGSVAISSGLPRRPDKIGTPRNDELILFSIFISISLFLYTFNHPYFFRYLIPLIPFFIYIAAWIITNSRPILALIPLISLILMTAKTFPKYLYEITRPSQTANAEIINFLSSLDPPKYQTLAVNYDDFTFRFHTSFIVYGAQHLRGDEGAFFPGNREPVTSKLELEPNPGIGRTLSERGFSRPASGMLSRRRASPEKNVPESPPKSSCPDVIIIFPDWGNEEKLRQIAASCQLQDFPLSLHYAKLADDPDPINHRFTPPPLRTLEAFLSPPSPS